MTDDEVMELARFIARGRGARKRCSPQENERWDELYTMHLREDQFEIQDRLQKTKEKILNGM